MDAEPNGLASQRKRRTLKDRACHGCEHAKSMANRVERALAKPESVRGQQARQTNGERLGTPGIWQPAGAILDSSI